MTDRFVTVPDSLELPAAVKVPVARLVGPTGAAATPADIGAATSAQGEKADASDVAALTLMAPLALTVPAGFPAGQVYRVTLTQDGTGGHTVTYDGQPVTVDLTAGAVTLVELHPAGAGYVVRYQTAAGRALATAPDAGSQRTLLGLDAFGVRSKITPDGADQAATLNAEIVALSASGGGTLVVGAGTFTFTGTIVLLPGVTVSGTPRAGAPATGATVGTRFVHAPTVPGTDLFAVPTPGASSYVYNIGVKHLYIVGSEASRSGLRLASVAWSHFADLRIAGFDEGITASELMACRFDRIESKANRVACIHMTGPSISTTTTFADCYLGHTTDHAASRPLVLDKDCVLGVEFNRLTVESSQLGISIGAGSVVEFVNLYAENIPHTDSAVAVIEIGKTGGPAVANNGGNVSITGGSIAGTNYGGGNYGGGGISSILDVDYCHSLTLTGVRLARATTALTHTANMKAATFIGCTDVEITNGIGTNTSPNVRRIGNYSGAYLANVPDTFAREGHNHTASHVTDLTETVHDVVGTLLVAGTNATVTYDDGAGTITISGATDPEVVRDVIGTALKAGTGIQVTVSDAGDTITVASTAVLPTRQVLSGAGLTGGGDLSADRTLAVSYGTTEGTAVQGNDLRFSSHTSVAIPTMILNPVPYLLPKAQTASAAGTAFWWPFLANRSTTIATLQTQLYTPEAGAYLRMGLYGMDANLSPTSLIRDFGITAAGDVAGVKTITRPAVTVPTSFMLCVWVSNHSTARWMRLQTEAYLGIYSDTAPNNQPGRLCRQSESVDYSAGLPATAPVAPITYGSNLPGAQAAIAYPIVASVI